MSVQRAEVHWARYLDGNRRVVLEADHARIVAEATAEARAAERRHWEARFRNAEQAHAAALAGMYELGKADGHLLGEEKAHRDSVIVHEGAAESRGYRRGLAAAPRTLTRDGWWPFGSFVDYDFPLEFDGEGEDGLPIWERPDKSRMQPRTLTADDRPDYKWDQEEVDDLRRQGYERGLADARAAVDAVGRWRSFPDDTLLSRAAVLAAIDALIHDGEDR